MGASPRTAARARADVDDDMMAAERAWSWSCLGLDREAAAAAYVFGRGLKVVKRRRRQIVQRRRLVRGVLGCKAAAAMDAATAARVLGATARSWERWL